MPGFASGGIGKETKVNPRTLCQNRKGLRHPRYPLGSVSTPRVDSTILDAQDKHILRICYSDHYDQNGLLRKRPALAV